MLHILVKFRPRIEKKTVGITLALQNIHLKIDFIDMIILSSTSQREVQQNFLFSYRVKRKIRLMWILIGAFQIRQNFILQLQKSGCYVLQESITSNLLNKRNELVTKCRHENKFILQRPATIIACSKHFFPKRL